MKNNTLFFIFLLSLSGFIFGNIHSLVSPVIYPGFNMNILDLSLLALALYWIFRPKTIMSLTAEDNFIKAYLLFCLVNFFSLVLTPLNLSVQERIISFAYQIRFISCIFVYLTGKYFIREKALGTSSLKVCLQITGIIAVSAGLIQYILYPNLRNLQYLGWDPHHYRIFGLYFDPNYYGIILVLIILFFIMFPIVRNKFVSVSFLGVLVVMLGITFSRSSYIALIFPLVFMLGYFRKIKYLLSGVVMVIVLLLIIPKPDIQSLNLLREFTVKTRIDNFILGLEMFGKRPLLGYGYNTIRYARSSYVGGGEKLLPDRSGAGFDCSLMTVAVSSGLLGLACYLYLLSVYFRNGGLLGRVCLIAVAVHSIFVNSLFYPFVWYWLLLIFPLGGDGGSRGKTQGI